MVPTQLPSWVPDLWSKALLTVFWHLYLDGPSTGTSNITPLSWLLTTYKINTNPSALLVYISHDIFVFVCFVLLKYSWFTMLCQSLLYSKVTQFSTYRHSFLNILFHYGLSQEIGYSSLCSTVGPWCLSILNVIVCVYQSQIPSPPLSLPLPLGNHKSDLYVTWHS